MLERAKQFVRLQAWLDATPEKHKHPRRKTWAGKIPDISAAEESLVRLLYDAGPVMSPQAGSLAPINWQELRAWEQQTGEALTPWESKAVIELSAAYLGQFSQAQKPDAPCPWVVEFDRDKVGRKVADMFKGLRASINGRHRKGKNRGGKPGA